MSEKIPDLDKLRFFRDEIQNEFSLLAMRSTMLVTVQSFLVVPFAILQTASDYMKVAPLSFVVGLLGIFVSLILIRPLEAAHQTINKWLIKQRKLFRHSKALEDLMIDRDKIPGANTNPDKDKVHMRSLAFSRIGPWAFIGFWLLAMSWSLMRVLVIG
jgi:hypothetical protein